MSQVMEVIGSWVNAIGTISSAISSTPMRGLKGEDRKRWEEISEQLDFGGNSLQAIGNIIEAFLGEPSVIEDAGEIIQASGNVTVLFSILAADEEEVDRAIKLDIIGNSQQAFGGLIAALEELTDEEFDVASFMGNFLQSIGNTLQALGGFVELEIEDLKVYFKETGTEEELSELSDGIIFNLLQEYPGSVPEPGASELSDDIIADEIGRLKEMNVNDIHENKTPVVENEIEYLFGRIPDYEPIEVQDETILTQQEESITSEEGEPSDLSDGIIFNVLQEVHEETETNPLIKQYEELALLLKYSGSWIQAGGSIISVYSEQNELLRSNTEQNEQEKSGNNKNPNKKRSKQKKSTEKESYQKKNTITDYSIVRKKS